MWLMWLMWLMRLMRLRRIFARAAMPPGVAKHGDFHVAGPIAAIKCE
jgi:hypothetical protein